MACSVSAEPLSGAPPGGAPLPARFARWFASRGWKPHAHQLDVLRHARAGRHVLLIAPTGGGKTLAGFLPSLTELSERHGCGLHTLYVSPLRALATDVARNLEVPVREMRLALRHETRSGDTPANRRRRQLLRPPDILLTTPESLALLLSHPQAASWFAGLRRIVIDELHALLESKRGVLLSLGLQRLRSLAPQARCIGLSATVADPALAGRWLAPHAQEVAVVEVQEAVRPEISILLPQARIPWSGHLALYAVPAIAEAIRAARMTLVFVNTRAQAELVFGALWRANDDNLPIGLHHGSLATEQRRRVEAAMARGDLRAVVCTSSLDLGIDWGAVDLVVQVGAPKGAVRLLQRIGRANHRLGEPSRALLVPGNRFELLECLAAIEAIGARELEKPAPYPGGLDVLAQHILGTACAGPFDPDRLFEEVRGAAPYRDLPRERFDAVLAFVAAGGRALHAYDRYRRLEPDDGRWRLADRRIATLYRMNVGTIVEAPLVRVRFARGRHLGEVEEHFIAGLVPGDTFLFAGRLLRFERMERDEAVVSATRASDSPKVPAYAGGRLPLSTHLADRVRAILADPHRHPGLPEPLREWLAQQARRSAPVAADELLVETFPHHGRHYLVAYCFAGRNAHQTLGMLLTRRLERAGLRPLGFAANDYCIATWSLEEVCDVDALFDVDMLGDDLETWLAESSVMRRAFRHCAVVAGLVERRHPGSIKTGRQVTVGADPIYEVLRKYEPDHVLLQAAREEAAHGIVDVRRLADMLVAIQGRIRHRHLDRISPFAVAIVAGIGREWVAGEAEEMLLDEFTAALVREALGDDD